MNVEQTIQQIERLYQTVTGSQLPTGQSFETIKEGSDIELDLERKIDLLLHALQSSLAPQATMPWVPTMNVWESENKIFLTFDIAGVSKEDIDVSVRGNLLTISGSKRLRNLETGYAPIRFEMKQGPFHRSIVLPIDAATAEIHTQVKDGILEIEVPKRATEHKGTVQ